jgi:hypothetical protein
MTNTQPIPDTPTSLEEALRIADHGIRVLPIKAGEKRPPMSAWQNAATTDANTIRNWFENLYRGAGLGIATGVTAHGDQLFVLDIDEHDPATSGGDTLHELENTHGKLPDTVEVHTGSGGRHLYFLAPVEIRNDAGRKLGPGLDIRGEGGQVVAPPTLHPNGRRYEWATDQGIGEITIAHAPTWLITLLTTGPKTPTPTTAPRTTSRDMFLAGDSIADKFNNSTTWDDLLTADGWTLGHTDNTGEQHWVRPGKTAREGTSATVGWNGLDVLKVFTSSIGWLDPEGAYSRFQYVARRDHGGDFKATARHIAGNTTTPVAPVIHEAVAPGEPWPEAIPLIDNTTTPTFPIDTLPEWITEHTLSVAGDLQVSPDLPANLALGALSVATIGNVTVNYPRQRWKQPTNLYMAVALPPSAGKSPAKNAMFSPIEALEEKRLQQAAAERHRAEGQRKILEKRQRAAEDRAAKHKGTEAMAAEIEALDLAEDIAKLGKVPNGKIIVDDVTTEALGVELAEAGGSIAVVSAEGGLFDRIAGMYNDQHANLDLYLEGWGGGRYSVSRIGRAPILVPKANVCVITTVQPAVLDAIGARPDFAGRGLTARFLLTIPTSNVGRRDRMRPSDGNERARTTYEAHLTDIADRVATTKPTLTVAGDTSDMFARWDQNLEDRLAPGQDLEHLSEWVGKLRASVLRIAGLLHLAENNEGDNISVATMSRALTLGNYYLAHAQTIAGRWGADGRALQARQILDWATREGSGEFSIRDLYRNLRRIFTDAEATRGPIELLIERGWIRPLFDGPLILGRGGKASPRFAVNPHAKSGDTRDTGDTGQTSGTSVTVTQVTQVQKDTPVSPVAPVAHRRVSEEHSLTHSDSFPATTHGPSDTRDTGDTAPDTDTGLF